MQDLLRTPRYDRLRELLIAARKRSGLTQTELAERLGCSQSAVSAWETGGRYVDAVEFIYLAEAIGADPAALIAEVAKERG